MSVELETLMRAAIDQARLAEAAGDVPIGAAIAREGRTVARAHNRRIVDADPTAHAEMLAIRAAAEALGDWRLTGCTMAATLEPCPMCAGAIVNAKVGRVIFGAYDAKMGASGSVLNVTGCRQLNHQPEVFGGILENRCQALLQDFFKGLRNP